MGGLPPALKAIPMDDWPCMQLERNLAEAAKKLDDAVEAVRRLRDGKPGRHDPLLPQWQEDLAVAIGREHDAALAYRWAARNFEKCKDENGPPIA